MANVVLHVDTGISSSGLRFPLCLSGLDGFHIGKVSPGQLAPLSSLLSQVGRTILQRMDALVRGLSLSMSVCVFVFVDNFREWGEIW